MLRCSATRAMTRTLHEPWPKHKRPPSARDPPSQSAAPQKTAESISRKPYQARIAGDGSSIAPGPGKNLMNQHVRCLNANARNAREETNHDMRLVLRSLFQLLRTHLFNLLDLVHDEPQAGHVSTKFEQRVGRERHPLGGPKHCETVRRVA